MEVHLMYTGPKLCQALATGSFQRLSHTSRLEAGTLDALQISIMHAQGHLALRLVAAQVVHQHLRDCQTVLTSGVPAFSSSK